jgi:hypothetical protein
MPYLPSVEAVSVGGAFQRYRLTGHQVFLLLCGLGAEIAREWESISNTDREFVPGPVGAAAVAIAPVS